MGWGSKASQAAKRTWSNRGSADGGKENEEGLSAKKSKKDESSEKVAKVPKAKPPAREKVVVPLQAAVLPQHAALPIPAANQLPASESYMRRQNSKLTKKVEALTEEFARCKDEYDRGPKRVLELLESQTDRIGVGFDGTHADLCLLAHVADQTLSQTTTILEEGRERGETLKLLQQDMQSVMEVGGLAPGRHAALLDAIVRVSSRLDLRFEQGSNQAREDSNAAIVRFNLLQISMKGIIEKNVEQIEKMVKEVEGGNRVRSEATLRAHTDDQKVLVKMLQELEKKASQQLFIDDHDTEPNNASMLPVVEEYHPIFQGSHGRTGVGWHIGKFWAVQTLLMPVVATSSRGLTEGELLFNRNLAVLSRIFDAKAATRHLKMISPSHCKVRGSHFVCYVTLAI